MSSDLKLIALPGKGLQYLTTRQPDESQIEVALKALQDVLAEDAAHAEEQKIRQFPGRAN